MFIGEIHTTHTQRGADAKKVRPGKDAAFRHWQKVVDLQLHGGDPTTPTEVALDGNAHSRVGHGCSDTAVGYPAAVSQVVAKRAVDRNAVAVHSVESHPEQGIERDAGQGIAELSKRHFWSANLVSQSCYPRPATHSTS
jgi:hypothetical protein